MRKVIYTRPDGGLSVVSPVADDDETLALVIEMIPADAVNTQVVDASMIPADRTFRNAWKAAAMSVEHDMEKCREIQRDRMRAARAQKFADLDVQYTKADEVGDAVTKARIASKKIALRNVTADPAIDAALTPVELKAVWPDCLK